MAEFFKKDDIQEYELDWFILDNKKLSTTTHPGAARIMLALDMHAKLLKIMARVTNPKLKEKQLMEFDWDSIKKITVSRKNPTRFELTLMLNKDICNHSLCVVAAKPTVLQKIHEVLNVAFFYLLNKRFKLRCAEMYKNIRILIALENPYNSIQIPNLPGNDINGNSEELKKDLLLKLENVPKHPAARVFSEEIIHIHPDDDLLEEAPEAREAPKVDSNPTAGNMGFDLYDILSLPSVVAIVCTLLVNFIYYMFFNLEM